MKHLLEELELRGCLVSEEEEEEEKEGSGGEEDFCHGLVLVLEGEILGMWMIWR